MRLMLMTNLYPQKKPTLKRILGQNRGQLIVEYLLFVVIVATAAVMLSKALVGRGEGQQGAIIIKWVQLLEMVGSDVGD